MSLFKMEPVALSSAVKALLGALVALGAIAWTGEQVAYVVVAMEAVFGLFIRQNVTPTFKVEQKVDAAVAKNEAEIALFLATEQNRKDAEFASTVLPVLAEAVNVVSEVPTASRNAAVKRVAKKRA